MSTDHLGSGPQSTSWLELCDQHLKVLKEHLQIWNHVKTHRALGTANHNAAQLCLDQTQEMIHNFQKLQTSFTLESQPQVSSPSSATKRRTRSLDSDNIHSTVSPNESGVHLHTAKRPRTEADPSSPSVPRHASPVKDASGLFSIDTRPTPVEQLQTTDTSKKAEKQLKRKLSGTGLHAIGATEILREVRQLPKRPRHLEVNAGVRHDAYADIPDVDDVETETDSFMAKVQQRFEEKESKRQRKPEKKRKRESNTSLEDHASGNFKPGKKKQKQENSSTNPTKESNKSKKRKAIDARKPKDKRNKA